MDVRTFIAELAKALGWPVAVVIILLFLRPNLRTLVSLLRHVKYGELEADFGEKLEKAEDKAEAAHLPPAAEPVALPPGQSESPFLQLRALVGFSPRAAILESWLLVERALQKFLAARNIAPTKLLVHTQLAALQKEGVLPRGVVALINDLRELRNRAVHAPEGPGPTVEQAHEYTVLSERVVRLLEQRAANPPLPGLG